MTTNQFASGSDIIEVDYIKQGDCATLLSELPDGCIDLTVTSPPYDSLRKYNGYTFDFQTIARELYRVTNPGGGVVWIVNDATVNGSETGTSFRQALYFKEIGFNLLDTMIWVKKGGGAIGCNNAYPQNTEYMFVFTKGKPHAVNFICDRPNKTAGHTYSSDHNHRRSDGQFKSRKKTYTTSEYGKRYNWWYCPRERGYGGHPATFPESIAQDHILSWSNEGDIVLDPFCGSGTTAKMALLNGRHYIGFDISQEYVDLANTRIEETIQSLNKLYGESI